jgi:hypothetical protein
MTTEPLDPAAIMAEHQPPEAPADISHLVMTEITAKAPKHTEGDRHNLWRCPACLLAEYDRMAAENAALREQLAEARAYAEEIARDSGGSAYTDQPNQSTGDISRTPHPVVELERRISERHRNPPALNGDQQKPGEPT